MLNKTLIELLIGRHAVMRSGSGIVCRFSSDTCSPVLALGSTAGSLSDALPSTVGQSNC